MITYITNIIVYNVVRTFRSNASDNVNFDFIFEKKVVKQFDFVVDK